MAFPKYKVALIQLYPKPMQLEQNFQKAATFIATAASRRVHLAVLPEYHLTNWVPEDPKFAGLCGQWQTYLEKYRDLARKHNICIVPGTIVERHAEKGDSEEERLVNVAYFIDNKGEVLGSYQKKNLW
jgi:predicted amidohydrolase